MRIKQLVGGMVITAFAAASLQIAAGAVEATEGVPVPREVIDLGALVVEDLPERVWGKRFLAEMGFDKGNSFEVVRWTYADGAVSGSNAYYTLFNHGGPHIDAPNHMGLEGGLDSYDVAQFSGPLKVFDVSDHENGRTVTVETFKEQKVHPGDVVLIYTGYSPPANETDLPRTITLTPEAATYLAELPIRAFGTDAWAVGNLQAEPVEGETGLARHFPIHHVFLSRRIPLYEQLFNVDQLLGKTQLYFTAAPLNIKAGDGMMVRPLVFVY